MRLFGLSVGSVGYDSRDGEGLLLLVGVQDGRIDTFYFNADKDLRACLGFDSQK